MDHEHGKYLTDEMEPHVDHELHCPFCGHNNIEVYDENDGYGRHTVSFMCDIEQVDWAPKGYLGCDVTIEINDYNVEECKEEYRKLGELNGKQKNRITNVEDVDGGNKENG